MNVGTKFHFPTVIRLLRYIQAVLNMKTLQLVTKSLKLNTVHICVDERLMNILTKFYLPTMCPKLSYRPLTLYIKTCTKVTKSLKQCNSHKMCFCLKRSKRVKFKLPSMLQTRGIEPIPQTFTFISLNHPSVTIFINCVYGCQT